MLRECFTILTVFPCLLVISPAAAKDYAADTVSMVFGGDIMISHGEENGKLIERGIDPFEPCANLLNKAASRSATWNASSRKKANVLINASTSAPTQAASRFSKKPVAIAAANKLS
jgi:hypothetical protein